MFQVRMSGESPNLPPIHDGNGSAGNVHNAHHAEHNAMPPKKPPAAGGPRTANTANTFNEILENDRLKTEVMVLRTKVKTLTDKLNSNNKEDPRIHQLEHVIKDY